MALLRVLDGRSTQMEFEIDRPLTIGRGDEGEVRIFDETSSRRHACVRPEGKAFLLEDLGSSNGTFLNGAKVERETLKDGDEILVGSTRFQFLLTPAGERGTVLISPPEESGLAVHSSIREVDFRVVEGKDEAEDFRRLTKAFEASRSLTGLRDAEEVLTRLLDILMEELEGDRAAVLQEADSGRLEIVASRGEGKKEPVLSRAVVRKVAKDREAVLIKDAETDPRFQERKSLLQQKVRSALCVPLSSGGEFLGILYVDRTKSGKSFGPRDLETLLAIAGQAAPALATARAFALERDRREDVERTLGGERVMVGGGPAFRGVLDLVDRAAGSDATVLLKGETGTGKELLARALHEKSPRRKGPFIAVNCAALVDTLMESELFGHEKGAFTGAARRKPGKFELAGGGTLFLDEVGEMALEVQAKLLRALQEREFYRVGGTAPVSVDIRIVAASNRDLKKKVEQGSFRQDLYYRLGVVTVDVPPLRKRREDIGDLVSFAVREACKRTKRRVEGVSPEAMKALQAYAWPGNIRELFNVIERAVVLTRGPVLDASLLPAEIRGEGEAPAPVSGVMTLKEAEKRAIQAALTHTGWKKGETAELLGISWPTLNKKIDDYGIRKP